MKCLVEGCVRQADTRGMCKACWTVATRRIKEGEVASWEFLESIGMALPRTRPEKGDTMFDQMLKEKSKYKKQDPQ